jgi:hypothetical protein
MLVCLIVLKCGSWVYEKFYSNKKHIIGGGSSSSQAAKLSLGVLYGHFSRYHLHYYYGVLVTCRQLQVHWRLQTSLVKKYVCSAPAL